MSGLFFQGTRCTFYERGRNKFPARYALRSSVIAEEKDTERERIRSSFIYIYMDNVDAAVNTSILNHEVTRLLVIIPSSMILHLNCTPAADKVELKHGRVEGMQLDGMRGRSRSASLDGPRVTSTNLTLFAS